MPPARTTKVRASTTIRSTVSRDGGTSLTRTKMGKMAIARDQEQMTHRRAAVMKNLTRQEKRLLVDVAPAIYNSGWEVVDPLDDEPMDAALGEAEWEDLRPSHAGGDFEGFHDLSEEMYNLTGRAPRVDYRTRNDRVHRVNLAWKAQYPAMVDAFLRWDSQGAPPDAPPGPASEGDVVAIVCVDLFEQKLRYFRASAPGERLNTTLVRHGHIGCSPTDPSLAFSLQALALYKAMGTRCPQLSIQAFVRSLCDLQHVPYRPYLRTQATIAIDAYMEIRRQIDARVQSALGRDSPDWRLRNACVPCTYRLEDELPLIPSMQTTMDANESLRRLERVQKERDGDGNVMHSVNIERKDERVLVNDYYLTPVEVDKYKDEVKKRLPKVDTPVKSPFSPSLVGYSKTFPKLAEVHQMAATAKESATPVDGADDLNPCVDRWKVMAEETAKKMWGVFDETGIFVCLCRHGSLLVMCDMIRSGELAKYPLAVVNRLIQIFGPDIMSGYDIGCNFAKTADSGELTGPEVRKARHCFICGSFHGHAHCRLCQLDWHPLYRDGAGLEDFEGCERAFYESNALARKTRYGSKFHRQQAIVQHFQRWNKDKHEALSRFLFNNFKQAAQNLNVLPVQLQEAKKVLGIRDDSVFAMWRREEKEYLLTLKKEPPSDILKIQYLETLKKLRAAEDSLDAISERWREVPVAELRRVQFYNQDWTTTNRLENARVAGLDAVLTLQQAVIDLEGKLGLDRRWEPGCLEWQTWEDHIARRDYYRAIDVLEGLVVSRLFELTKMNQSETGYKLRTKIASALRARSAAIRTAIKRYNEAALKLPEQRTPLDVKTVLDYVFLAQFDLLRDSRHELQNKPWAHHAERLAADTWHRLQRSREELERVMVEVRRLKTWTYDEEELLESKLATLQETDPLLAPQVRKQCDYQVRVNVIHRDLVARMESSSRWTGPRTRGRHRDTGLTNQPTHASTDGRISSPRGESGGREQRDNGDDWDVIESDEDEMGEDDTQHGPGALMVVWDALGDGSQSVSDYV